MADLPLQWQPDTDDRDRSGPDRQQRRLLLWAVGASLALHAVIVVVLVNTAGRVAMTPIPGAVSINLVPSNPYSVPLPEADVPETLAIEPEPEPDLTTETAAADPIAPPVDAASLLVPAEAAVAEASAPENPAPTIAVPAITVPSLQAVQQTLQALSADAAARSWLYACNPLETEAGVRTCEQQATADFGAVERNSHYEALNPVRQATRSERSVGTVYQNTAGVAGALDTSAIAPGLADYVIAELEAGTSVYTNNGTDRVQHMRRITDQSAAAKQAERVLGDAWVRSRAVELQQRKVEID